MIARTSRLAFSALAVLSLSACAGGGGANSGSVVAWGGIELALSTTCAETSVPQCVDVQGEGVMLPDEFQRATVQAASVAKSGGQNAVDLTLDSDGGEVLRSLTKDAVDAGQDARLLMRVGGEIRAAVVVMEELNTEHLQILLSPGEKAQEIVDQIHGS